MLSRAAGVIRGGGAEALELGQVARQQALLQRLSGVRELAIQACVLDRGSGPQGEILGEREVAASSVRRLSDVTSDSTPTMRSPARSGARIAERMPSSRHEPRVLVVGGRGAQQLVADVRQQLGATAAQHALDGVVGVALGG